jgi:hypothetical protein
MMYMYKLFIIVFLFAPFSAYSQALDFNKLNEEILNEGKRIYQSELASWRASDIVQMKYPGMKEIGGYLSYADGWNIKTIFFSKGDSAKVIYTVLFDTSRTLNKASVDTNTRDFLPIEHDYFKLKQKVMSVIQTDSLFKIYKRTSLNIVPLIDSTGKKVYIITSTKEHKIMYVGNDYLLTFDKDNELLTKKRLHQTLIPIPCRADTVKYSYHTHSAETGDFITPTDVASLMLYEVYSNWEYHFVFGMKYSTIWDCKSNSFVVYTKEEFDRIIKKQK